MALLTIELDSEHVATVVAALARCARLQADRPNARRRFEAALREINAQTPGEWEQQANRGKSC